MEATTPSQVEDTSLGELHALTFTKQQWIIIWNILVGTNPQALREYPLGLAKALLPIIDQIEPIVASLSDKDIKKVNINGKS